MVDKIKGSCFVGGKYLWLIDGTDKFGNKKYKCFDCCKIKVIENRTRN